MKIIDLLANVVAMHIKFNVYNEMNKAYRDKRLTREYLKRHRIIALMEEIEEFQNSRTDAEELDALIDLIIFALGTVDLLGYRNIFNEAFEKIMEANMKKKLGPVKKRGSFEIDLVKPRGWKPADLKPLIAKIRGGTNE